uniref:Uncharacterized protein n=1 Tax=Anopheles christyi TaxID=43041 RepID=A0A182K6G7_9DIPT
MKALRKCQNCTGSHSGNDSQCPLRSDSYATSLQLSSETPEQSPVPTSPEYHQIFVKTFLIIIIILISSNPPETVPSSAEENSLHDADTLLMIFKEMIAKFRACRTKANQIAVLGEIIIRYG